jgi:protein PsiE
MSPTRLIGMSERILLGLVVVMTLMAVGLELWGIYQLRDVTLADILLLFLYAEVLSMVKVYYARERAAFLYPILIAMTALSRLIVLQSKEMDPAAIFFEASAILILAIALVLMRSPVLRGLVDRSLGDRPTGHPAMDQREDGTTQADGGEQAR